MKWMVLLLVVGCSSKTAPPPTPVTPVVVDAAPADASSEVNSTATAAADAGASVVDAAPARERCPACGFACTGSGEEISREVDANGCPVCGCVKRKTPGSDKPPSVR